MAITQTHQFARLQYPDTANNQKQDSYCWGRAVSRCTGLLSRLKKPDKVEPTLIVFQMIDLPAYLPYKP